MATGEADPFCKDVDSSKKIVLRESQVNVEVSWSWGVIDIASVDD